MLVLSFARLLCYVIEDGGAGRESRQQQEIIQWWTEVAHDGVCVGPYILYISGCRYRYTIRRLLYLVYLVWCSLLLSVQSWQT